jgi:hypothetical protein
LSEDYIKQLEETIELLKKKFEDYSIENESLKSYFWNDLTCILPKQEGDKAYCLVYTPQGNAGGSNYIGLTLDAKDYSSCHDDIVTVSEVWDIIYNKPASTSFSFLDKVKHCKDISVNAEIVRTLYTVLLKEANRIAQDTRRTSGNVVVVSEEVASQITILDQFIGVENKQRYYGFRIYKIGEIGRFTIFVDKNNTTNKAVVIYRSAEKENDGAGVILDNKGIHQWFRPMGYENFWNVIDIT